MPSLVGSEMCIRDSCYCSRLAGFVVVVVVVGAVAMVAVVLGGN